MKSVQTSLSKPDWLLLRAEAAERELSLYELVRDILTNYIHLKEKHHGKKEPK